MPEAHAGTVNRLMSKNQDWNHGSLSLAILLL